MTFLFSMTASGVCCLFLLLQRVSPSGSMAFLMFSSPCNLPPSPLPHHKHLYSVYKKVKTNMYATYFIYPAHSMGTEIPPLNPAHSYVDLVIVYLWMKIRYASHGLFCEEFSKREEHEWEIKTQIRKKVRMGWGACEQKYRIRAFIFYLRIISMERMKNNSPYILLADIVFTFVCLGHQVFQSGNVTICFPF